MEKNANHMHLEGWLKYWVTGLFRDGFKRRWLLREGEKIFIFESEHTLEHTDVIDLNRVVAVRPVENGFGTNETEKLGFKLVTDDDKKYYFLATSVRELKQWVRGIVTWVNHLNRLYKRDHRELLTYFFATDGVGPDGGSRKTTTTTATEMAQRTGGESGDSTRRPVAMDGAPSALTAASSSLTAASTSKKRDSSGGGDGDSSPPPSSTAAAAAAAAMANDEDDDNVHTEHSRTIVINAAGRGPSSSSPSTQPAPAKSSPAKRLSRDTAASQSSEDLLQQLSADDLAELRLIMQNALRAKLSDSKVQRLYTAVASLMARRKLNEDGLNLARQRLRERDATIAQLQKQAAPASSSAAAAAAATSAGDAGPSGAELRQARQRIVELEAKLVEQERRRVIVSNAQSQKDRDHRARTAAILRERDETIATLTEQLAKLQAHDSASTNASLSTAADKLSEQAGAVPPADDTAATTTASDKAI